MKKVPAPRVVAALGVSEIPLPAQIQEALDELVGAAREGLLALSVGVGLGVVHELMELELTEVVGPEGEHNRERTAKRHGHEGGSMTLGGRRVQVRRPRMRTADDERELPVRTYEYFADRDPLTRAVIDRMLAGVSTRKFAAVGESVGSEVDESSSATSKTSVSEMFVERTATALSELMSRRPDDVRLAVMMLDGMEVADATHVVALGITTEGVKIPLGLWEGSTENATLARTLLPERDRDAVRGRMRAVWTLTDAELAEQRLQLLAAELDRGWPDAAASLREGMPETLTLTRLGIAGQLAKTLCSMNPCESMIEIVRYAQRNVKRWRDGDMRKRWRPAGMLVAEQQFRRIIGYRDLANLVIAVERHALRTAPVNIDRQEVAEPATE